MADKKDGKGHDDKKTPARVAELELATLRHVAMGSPGDEPPEETPVKKAPAPAKVPNAMGT